MAKTDSLFTYGEFQNVKLSEDERAKLFKRIGPKNAQIYIEKLSSYIATYTDQKTGKVSGPPGKYKWHYSVILTWARNDHKLDLDEEFDGNEDGILQKAELIHLSLKREAEYFTKQKAEHRHTARCEGHCRFEKEAPRVPNTADILMRLRNESTEMDRT